MLVPKVPSSAHVVRPQSNGPITAATRADNNIKLKYRPASISGINDSSSGRSIAFTPPKLSPIARPTNQKAFFEVTAIIQARRATQIQSVIARHRLEIGRASCRERAELEAAAAAV